MSLPPIDYGQIEENEKEIKKQFDNSKYYKLVIPSIFELFRGDGLFFIGDGSPFSIPRDRKIKHNIMDLDDVTLNKKELRLRRNGNLIQDSPRFSTQPIDLNFEEIDNPELISVKEINIQEYEGTDFIKLFDSITEGRTKVWFIGSFKVGKSTIINEIISKNILISSDLVHTKGEEMVLSEIKINDEIKKYVFVDTEGFYQPMDDTNSSVKKDFIMNHMRVWSDIIIVVVDRMIEYELKLILDMMKLLSTHVGRLKKLIVIHNVKTMTSLQDLNNYAYDMFVNYHNQNLFNTMNPRTSWCFDCSFQDGLTLTNLFMGNIREGLVKDQVSFLRKNVLTTNSTTHTSFSSSLKESIRFLTAKHCMYMDFHPLRMENRLAVRSKDATRVKNQSTQPIFRMENNLQINWYSSEDELMCLVTLPHFLLTGVKIENDETFILTGFVKEPNTFTPNLYQESVNSFTALVIKDMTVKELIKISAKEKKGEEVKQLEYPRIVGMDMNGNYLLRFEPNNENWKSQVNSLLPVIDIYRKPKLDEYWGRVMAGKKITTKELFLLGYDT